MNQILNYFRSTTFHFWYDSLLPLSNDTNFHSHSRLFNYSLIVSFAWYVSLHPSWLRPDGRILDLIEQKQKFCHHLFFGWYAFDGVLVCLVARSHFYDTCKRITRQLIFIDVWVSKNVENP